MARKTNRKDRRELIKELKRKREDISVEITNISYVRCKYKEPHTNYKYFDLKMGDSAILDLVELQEVVNKCRFMFSCHYLLVTDVIVEDGETKYSIDDIINYLGLMDIYVDLEDHTIDYIEDIIYEYEVKDFKDLINRSDRQLLVSIAGRMLSLFKEDPYDIDRQKIEIISDKLNIRDLFQESWM